MWIVGDGSQLVVDLPPVGHSWLLAVVYNLTFMENVFLSWKCSFYLGWHSSSPIPPSDHRSTWESRFWCLVKKMYFWPCGHTSKQTIYSYKTLLYEKENRSNLKQIDVYLNNHTYESQTPAMKRIRRWKKVMTVLLFENVRSKFNTLNSVLANCYNRISIN